MYRIDMDTIDELYRIILEYEIIIYLQECVQYDFAEQTIYDIDPHFNRDCAAAYLLDRHFETIAKLNKLFDEAFKRRVDAERASSDEKN